MKFMKKNLLKSIFLILVCIIGLLAIYVLTTHNAIGLLNNKMLALRNDNGSIFMKYFLLCTSAFFCITIFCYYIFIQKNIRLKIKNEKKAVIVLIVLGLIVRIILALLVHGYPDDIICFKVWATSVAKNLPGFYISPQAADYPPLYLYLLFIIGKLGSLGITGRYFVLLLKLPAIIADMITAYIIYRLARRRISVEISMLLVVFFVFNPAILTNSSLWGQVDSLFALFIVAGMYFMIEEKLELASVMLAFSVLMKPQGIIFLPVLFFELVRRKKLKNFFKSAGIALVVALLVVMPFNANRNILWIVELYKKTVAEYPYATMNAYNLFYLFKANYVDNSLSFLFLNYHTWGMIFIVLTTLFSWYIYVKGNNAKFGFLCALIQISGVYTLSVGMHDRYLFPAVILAILSYIYLKDRRLLVLAIGFSFTVYLNTHVVLFKSLGGNINPLTDYRIGMVVSFINVLLLIYLIIVSISNLISDKAS
ncbi:glycosyltransferase 87 family protein [Clostridium fungisolvens]|uniref:DUF2029 domain-containing protein n=1 Tax=Clostridium fungisolvens TaxID=1604897 RepID=A0A6V8SK07_9CLOT|nr:glycosyltransferase 87 family protein [Clostridium fungisolvens]GFP75233.1 hypothetical protein bsdtw1_01306 [Clostridium fungisolvens]